MNKNSWPIEFNAISDNNFGSNGNQRIFNEFELTGIIVKTFTSKVACINVNLVEKFALNIFDPLNYFVEDAALQRNINNVLNIEQLFELHNNYAFTPIYVKEKPVAYLISDHKLIQIELDKFNQILNKKIELIQERFIRTNNDIFIESLKESINSLSRINYRLGFERFWKKVEDTLELLVQTYPAKHVSIFALRSVYTFDNKTLDMVASFGLSRHSYKNYSYNVSEIDLNYRGEMLTSLENPNLLNYLKEKNELLQLSPDEDLIRILPAPFSIDSTIIIWVKYNNVIWPRLLLRDPNSRSSVMFHKLITSFYIVLVSSYSSLLSSHTLDMIEESWRVLSHETGQISAAIDRLRKAYIDNHLIKTIETYEIEDINKNLKGLVHQYNYLSLNTKSLIKGTPNIQLKKFYIFGEFLFKWQSIYKMASEKKRIQIIVPTDFKSKNRPQIYSDSLLVEQTLYNLINNAVKYGREGTRIYINYYVKKYDKLPTKIEVSNYGSEIIEIHKIWELFGREENNPEEGIGIGLFISREIMRALKGKIELTQEKVSELNVAMLSPLIENYHLISPAKREKHGVPKKEVLINELQRLRRAKLFKKIINLRRGKQFYRPKRIKILQLFKKHTYLIKFQINLP